MLTEQQRKRFSELREREENGTLDASEQEELNSIIQYIEARESEYLRPATERIRQERLQLHSQNAALKTLMRRQERHVRRLERFLALSKAERAAIQSRLLEILNPLSTGVNRS